MSSFIGAFITLHCMPFVHQEDIAKTVNCIGGGGCSDLEHR